MRESGENYLEVIYHLSEKKETVRSVDIATEIGISRPSVFRALENLRAQGFIEKEYYGEVRLTESGIRKAEDIIYKHNVITEFLMKSIRLERSAAETDACRIEHIIAPETVAKMAEFNEKS